MKRIYKFTLGRPNNEPVRLAVPKSFDIFKADLQDGLATVWGSVQSDKSDDQEVRIFWMVGTGRDIPDNVKHLGTFFDGYFAWHVFEDLDD